MLTNFQNFLTEIKSKLSNTNYKIYTITPTHIVIEIEKQNIISILLKKELQKDHIIVEEIFTPEQSCKPIKSFCKKYAKSWVSYYEFTGELGNPKPLIEESQYENIKKQLPQLKIDEKYNNWPGYNATFVALKLQDNSTVGYAVAQYSQIENIASLKTVAQQLINAYINSKDNQQSTTQAGTTEYVKGTSVYNFILDKNMCEILEKRYILCKTPYQKNDKGFEIGDILGKWYYGHTRNKNEFPKNIFERIKKENDTTVQTNFVALYTPEEQKHLPKPDELQQEFYYLEVAYVDIFEQYKTYNYLSEDTSIRRGDKVVVNRNGAETVAIVLNSKLYKRYEVPFPVEKTKSIIKKIETDEELEKYGFTHDDFMEYYDDEDDEDDEEDIVHRYFIITTLSDNVEIIKKISHNLLENNLVAGSQISEVLSSFWWNGKIESKKEYKLEVRTRDDKILSIRELIKSIHNYEIPEISIKEIFCATLEMQKWIDESLQYKFFKLE